MTKQLIQHAFLKKLNCILLWLSHICVKGIVGDKVGKLGCRYMARGLEDIEMDHLVSETSGGFRISCSQVI